MPTRHFATWGLFYFENSMGSVFCGVERAAVKRVVSPSENTRITNKPAARNSRANPGRKAFETKPAPAARSPAARGDGRPTWAVDFCGGTEGEPCGPVLPPLLAAVLLIHFSWSRCTPTVSDGCVYPASANNVTLVHLPFDKQQHNFKVARGRGRREMSLAYAFRPWSRQLG